MNIGKEQAIAWALEAKVHMDFFNSEYNANIEQLCALAYAAGAKAENEACAKLIESRKTGADELMDSVRNMEARAIRARMNS